MLDPLPGQEEIWECFKTKNSIKMWQIVQYAGYNIVRERNLRKLCFLAAYNDFDPNINNNFITFYMTRLRYFAINDYKIKTKPIISDKRAQKDYRENCWWPTKNNETPVNQNSNILRMFNC